MRPGRRDRTVRRVGRPAARTWHGLTALVAAVALVVQVALVVSGESVLVTTGEVPPTSVRLARFASYFTVQSNALVLLTSAALALRPDRDGWAWRVLRLDALLGITVTGLVHWFLLRPLLDLEGASYVTDTLLHVAVPALALGGWLLFGPRPRLATDLLLPALGWPVAWLVFTVLRGAGTGWYPYPFLDVGVRGGAAVAATSVGVAALLVAVAVVLQLAERRLGPAPRPEGVSAPLDGRAGR